MTLLEYVAQWFLEESKRLVNHLGISFPRNLFAAKKLKPHHRIAIDPARTIFLGGDFVQSDSIAKYNGAVWNAVKE